MAHISQFPLECLGFAHMTSMTTARPLENIPSGANIVWLQATAQIVRIRCDGGNPTATQGNRLNAGGLGQWISLDDLSKIRVIEAAGGALLNVSYFRQNRVK